MKKRDVVKILQKLRKEVKVKAGCGWYVLEQKCYYNMRDLAIGWKYVVDHHQASGDGRIFHEDFFFEMELEDGEYVLMDDRGNEIATVSDGYEKIKKSVEKSLIYEGF